MKKDTPKSLLTKRLLENRARICIVGLGYVGLPLAVEFAKKGFSVNGIDCDVKKISLLKKGKSYIQDVGDSQLKNLLKKKRFSFSNSYSSAANSDVVIICVPTPLRKTKEPDISFIVEACKKIRGKIKKGQLIVLESTSYPGTTEELLLDLLSQGKFKVGEDFFLAFSPERVDPGNEIYNTSNITKIVGGVTKNCTFLAKLLYSQVVGRVISVSNARVAEMAKLLENTFRAVNIGLINEIALMCDKLNINVWEVIDAAKTKPFGFMAFYPGPGLGGHCLPVDPHYLTWKARLYGFEPRLIDVASQINSNMPAYIVNKVIELVNQRAKRSIKGAKILVIGVSYKKNVSDIRESPALEIIRLLKIHKAQVAYFDPYVAQLKFGEKILRSTTLSKSRLKGMHCVVIVTNHDKIDFNFILDNSKIIFDTRNVYKNKKDGRIAYFHSN